MDKEGEDIIKQYLDNKEGTKMIHNLLLKSKNKKDVNLLEMTGIEKKIKLKNMTITWNFTRTWPMVIRMVETMFYIFIS